MSASDDVQEWAEAARRATIKRDEAIRRMRAEGASLRAIGEVADLSHTAIAKILARRDLPRTKSVTP